MERYKITFTYIDFTDTMHGKRINSYDEYKAENAQDAVDQCRQDFYVENQLEIASVAKWSLAGYWMPVFDNAWM